MQEKAGCQKPEEKALRRGWFHFVLFCSYSHTKERESSSGREPCTSQGWRIPCLSYRQRKGERRRKQGQKQRTEGEHRRRRKRGSKPERPGQPSPCGFGLPSVLRLLTGWAAVGGLAISLPTAKGRGREEAPARSPPVPTARDAPRLSRNEGQTPPQRTAPHACVSRPEALQWVLRLRAEGHTPGLPPRASHGLPCDSECISQPTPGTSVSLSWSSRFNHQH